MRYAFSLIELMVVIAIIAVLAAVAIPAYSDYVIRSKISVSIEHINRIADLVTEYYNINGEFPTSVAQLGYNEGDTPGTTSLTGITSNTIAPYIPSISLAPMIDAYSCPNAYILSSYLSGYDNGDLSFAAGGTGESYGSINVAIADINGVMTKECYFFAYTQALSDPHEISGNIGGCVNVLSMYPGSSDHVSDHFDAIIEPFFDSCS